MATNQNPTNAGLDKTTKQNFKKWIGTSLAVQWLGLHLPMQGVQV